MSTFRKFVNLLRTTHNTEEVYKLYVYNDNNFRIVHQKYCKIKGLEEISKPTDFIPKTESEEVQRISLSRSKRNIRELALCNDFQYFATLTINSEFGDRFSLEDCQEKLKIILHAIKRKYKDFKFLFITEKHKDGAFHFHGLVKNLPLYINQYGYFSCTYFDKLGFNSFSKIKDYNKTCNYILKYITKDCIKNQHNQIYICSRGLKKASVQRILPTFPIPFSFSNDFVDIYDFSPSSVSKDLLINLLQL